MWRIWWQRGPKSAFQGLPDTTWDLLQCGADFLQSYRQAQASKIWDQLLSFLLLFASLLLNNSDFSPIHRGYQLVVCGLSLLGVRERRNMWFLITAKLAYQVVLNTSLQKTLQFTHKQGDKLLKMPSWNKGSMTLSAWLPQQAHLRLMGTLWEQVLFPSCAVAEMMAAGHEKEQVSMVLSGSPDSVGNH